MAQVNYFFDEETGYVDYGSFMNQYLVIDLANRFMRGDLSRIVYADNASCFRVRSDTATSTTGSVVPRNTGNVTLPFINFIQKEGTRDDRHNWYHWRLDKPGVYCSELETRVRMVPIQLTYESTFWCSSAKEMRYMANELYFMRENHTDITIPIEYSFVTGSGVTQLVDMEWYGKLNFEIEVDPEYEMNEWLANNVKHSIGMNFELNSWGIKLDTNNVSITEKSILRFTETLSKEQLGIWTKTIELT